MSPHCYAPNDTKLSFSKTTYIFPCASAPLPACLTAVLGQHIMKPNTKGAFGLSIPYSRTIIGNIPWYSVLIALGVLLASLLAEKEEKRLGLPQDTTLDLAMVVVPFGIVGARLYYVLMSWESFAHNPISILYVWEGGIAIYGAVLGGMLGAWLFARRRKLSFLTLADIIVPGLLLAQAIGRWGNYFNMEAYGPEITQAAYRFFPLGVQIPAGDGFTWHMAAFFYESMWNLCGFAALWLLRKRQRAPGNLLCWYLLIYGSGRFVIEQLRQDSLYIGSLRASQYLSLVLCAGAACVLLWRACKQACPAVFQRVFPACAAAAAAVLSRWFWVGKPFPYLLLAAGALGCALWVTAATGRQGAKRAVWLLPLILLDVLCLWAACAHPDDSMLRLLHALVCSAAIPLLVWWLIRTVETNRTAKEEREPCPSER